MYFENSGAHSMEHFNSPDHLYRLCLIPQEVQGASDSGTWNTTDKKPEVWTECKQSSESLVRAFRADFSSLHSEGEGSDG